MFAWKIHPTIHFIEWKCYSYSILKNCLDILHETCHCEFKCSQCAIKKCAPETRRSNEIVAFSFHFIQYTLALLLLLLLLPIDQVILILFPISLFSNAMEVIHTIKSILATQFFPRCSTDIFPFNLVRILSYVRCERKNAIFSSRTKPKELWFCFRFLIWSRKEHKKCHHHLAHTQHAIELHTGTLKKSFNWREFCCDGSIVLELGILRHETEQDIDCQAMAHIHKHTINGKMWSRRCHYGSAA